MKGPAEGTGVREVQIQETRKSARGRKRHGRRRTLPRTRRALAEPRIGRGGARRVAVETPGRRGGAQGGLSRSGARPDVSELSLGRSRVPAVREAEDVEAQLGKPVTTLGPQLPKVPHI